MSQDAIRKEWEALNAKTENVAPEVTGNSPEKILENETVDSVDTSEPDINTEENLVPESTKSTMNSRNSEDQANFKRLRDQNKELERKLYELENKLKGPEPKEPSDEVEDYDLRDDDITEGKHYKALKKQVKSLNEAILKERAERDKLAAEARLRANYPDIFNVITKENMEELAKVEPELVESIISSPNTYAQHVSAYKLIKKYGIGTQDPYAEDKARVQKNMAKPRSSASVAPRMGESPLADAERFANGMTPELQAQLLREMEDAISNR